MAQWVESTIDISRYILELSGLQNFDENLLDGKIDHILLFIFITCRKKTAEKRKWMTVKVFNFMERNLGFQGPFRVLF